MNEKQLARDMITETIIYKKARALNGDLWKLNPGTSTEETSLDAFKASRGSFDNFKKDCCPGMETRRVLTRRDLKI